MFVLAKFKYNARIAAQDFGVDVVKALTDSINAEFSNHVRFLNHNANGLRLINKFIR